MGKVGHFYIGQLGHYHVGATIHNPTLTPPLQNAIFTTDTTDPLLF